MAATAMSTRARAAATRASAAASDGRACSAWCSSSARRTTCADATRVAKSAIKQARRGPPTRVGSFMTERPDRIQGGRAMRWKIAKSDTDGHAEARRQRDAGKRDHARPAHARSNDGSCADTERDSRQSAEGRENQSLDQELQQNLLRRGADGPTNSDFLGPFSDRNELNVHDANASDQK